MAEVIHRGSTCPAEFPHLFDRGRVPYTGFINVFHSAYYTRYISL
jgi:hypothetical protein